MNNVVRWLCVTLVFATSLVASRAFARNELPNLFSDHMVLQRGVAAPVWGWTHADEEVIVRFANQEKRTRANSRGRWMVRFDPMPAHAEGRPLEIQSDGKTVINDVLVGDVWICSGQSNMEWSVSNSLNSDAEIAAAQFPTIRLYNVPGHTTSPYPRAKAPGSWNACSPDSVKGFSAVGYYFGRHVHRESGVPIGLLGTNWGGTRIEPWTPPIGFRGVPELKAISEQVDRFDATVPSGKATWDKYFKEVETWVANARDAVHSGATLPDPVATPGYRGGGDPTAIYNAMVHPLAPFGLRGAIWYQGESNGDEGVEYYHKMRALIEGWRKVWNQEDAPIYFYFVQLANFQKPNEDPAGDDAWSRLREAQRQSLTIPHTGMAVTIDIGKANDIHPRNKQDVGTRLALWALRDTHGKDLVVSGPLYREMKAQGSKIELHFDHVGSGLMIGKKDGLNPTQPVADAQVARLAIAGADRKWHWAKSTVLPKKVVVWSDEVPQPVAVRYAFSKNPEGANLYNQEGLPASPFRTDAW